MNHFLIICYFDVYYRTLEDAINLYGYNCDCVEEPIMGCNDPLAMNYDETSNSNDSI